MSNIINNCVVTFLYPKSEKFIEQFVNCLEEQTFKKFDILFFCDGLNFNKLKLKTSLKYKYYNLEGSISEIRQKTLKIIKKLKYKKVFFCDIDDLYQNNRIQVLNKLLSTNDIVFNDINCLSEKKKLIKRNFFSNFFKDNEKINYKSLINQNFLGFSNTACKINILKKSKFLNSKRKVNIFDWYFWSKVLKKNKACFTNKTKTYYRVSLKSYTRLPVKISTNYLNNSVYVKYNFYKTMRNDDRIYNKMYINYSNLYVNRIKLNKLIKKTIIDKKNKHFSWWGGIEL